MAFQLTVEQVNFASEDFHIISTASSSLDSLNSVVDANVDFKPTALKSPDRASEHADLANKWKTDMDVPVEFNNSSPKHTEREILQSKQSEITVITETPNVPLDEANSAFSYDSLSATYPKIPLRVAQFINETNPEWYLEAERYKKMSETPDLIPNQCSGHLSNEARISLPTPLKSMAASSEALALQQSVIGNPTISPVSADVVAQVVRDAQLKFQQQNVRNQISQNSSNRGTLAFTNASGTYYNPNISTNNMIQYPTDNFQSNIDKKSWLSNFNQNSSNVPKPPTSSASVETIDSRRSSCSSMSSLNCSRRTLKSSESEIPSVHSSKKQRSKLPKESYNSQTDGGIFSGKYLNTSVDWETESCFSEKLEVASVCSEAFETESNFSEVSGMDEEMFQVKRFLADIASNGDPSVSNSECQNRNSNNVIMNKNSSPETNCMPYKSKNVIQKDQSTETEFPELFELLRAKANLEGRLESVSKNEVDLSKERVTLQTLVASLQAQLKALTKQMDFAVVEKQGLQKELDLQKIQHDKWDNIMKEYQNIIETKSSEIRALKEDLSEAEQANTQARINYEELKVDMESCEGAVAGLKKKIAEQHVETQVLLQGKIQCENEVKNVRHEIDALQKSRSWYQEQLRSAQETCNKLHQELITLKANQVTSQNAVEKSKTEIANLKNQLKESQHRAVVEKEMLMKHLETIEADMKERESLFEEMQKDKGSVEDALIDRAKRMKDERTEIAKLTIALSDLEYHLSIAKSDIGEKNNAIMCLEKEKAEFSKQVVILQKTMNDKDFSVQQLTQELKVSASKLKHIEMALQAAEELSAKLKEEKTAADVALASANEEKRVVNESLIIFKENLNRVENNFKQMRVELVAKTSKVEQLLKEKSILEESLKKLEEGILNQQKTYELQIINQSQNRDVVVDDLKKQKHDIENILSVYGKDLQKYRTAVQSLENERNDLKNEIIKLKVYAQNTEERLESLNTENVVLKERISGLEVHLKKPENELCTLNVKSDVRSVDLISELHRKDSKKLKVYQSNIKLLTRKLKEKMELCKTLTNQVNDLKSSLEESKNLLAEQISKDVDSDELFKERNKTSMLEAEIKHLQETLDNERKQVEKNQELIIELEKDKGRTGAISDSNNTLKATISELESVLAEKDSAIAQLNCQIKDFEAKLSENSISYDRKLRNLEEDLNKERTVVKGLRQQVFQEKRANSHLQRQLTTLKSGLKNANQTADSRKKEMNDLQAEIDRRLQAEVNYRSELEQLQTVIRNRQAEVDQLNKEMEEFNARDPALAEQLKSLSWHLKEKNNEVKALKEKQTLLEERHQVEISGLKKTIENLEADVKRYKSELDSIMQEKFRYQKKFAELRKMFKKQFGNAKAACDTSDKANGATKDGGIDFYFPDPQSTIDESYINSLLEKSFPLPDNRPLNQLQECLNSLKLEMAELQRQIHDNKDLFS